MFGGNLRLVPIGGAPIAPDAERFLREARFPYAIGYGLTETSPLVSGSSAANCRLQCAGTPLPGTLARIADKHPRTGEGEIQVKGPGVMQGYYKAPEITAEVITEDGWLRTGDLGVISKDGYISIKGRIKNVVIGPSGENIYPEEVESLFFASPYVQEVLVYEYAKKLTARVHLDATRLDELFGGLSGQELRQKTRELLESIRAEVNSKVSSFAKIHRIIEQTEPFEKTPTQKIKRYLYVDS
jgi:long-chain acyl-CoA synthetase